MIAFSEFVPEHIRKLAETNQAQPLKQSSAGSTPVALNLNENPFGPSPLAVKAIQKALSDVHRYPEIQAADLHDEVAGFHGVKPEQVLISAGATELLCMIARTLLAPGLNAVTSAKSFIVYRLATQVTEGKLIEVPTRRNNGYDLDAIADSVDRNTRIVFIANPNNPTGTLLTADEITHFVEGLPEHVLVVLDEAYGEFTEYFGAARKVVYSQSLDYVRRGLNVIVLKTFSKTHGLAGLRVGYGIGPARLISWFAPMRTIFSVSSMSQVAASTALHDSEHIRRAVENNAEQAEVLTAAMEKLGFPLPETWANFVYCELGRDAAAFADRLRVHGVVIQPLGLWGAPTAIRVSIGTPEQNEKFVQVLKIVANR